MAISPIVQQHQQSIVQQSSTPEQLTFNKEFGDAAYELLSAKYPRLLPYVVTFKVLDAGVEDSEDNNIAVGTFVISVEDEVEYIPVVLHDGAIVSCEMLYNKQTDTFKPLIAKQVKAVVDINRTTDHTLVKNPNVEQTEQVYRNMFRPPMSSRPILAASVNILESLPDEAKKKLYDHFTTHPEVLAKVASFYPVEALAAKLAPGKHSEKVAAEKEIETLHYLDKVIKLEDLTKEAAEMLSDDMKADVLENGYAIAVEIEEPAGVIPKDDLATSVEKVLNVQEFAGRVPVYGTGNLLKLHGTKLVKVPCILAGERVITAEGAFYYTGDGCHSFCPPGQVHDQSALVVADFKDGVTEDDINNSGLFTPACADGDSVNTRMSAVAYPSRQGLFKFKHAWYQPGIKQVIDEDLYIGSKGKQLCFTNSIDKGMISSDHGTPVFPMNSYISNDKASGNKATKYVKSIQQLITIIQQTNTPLQIKQDGPDINLINRALDKTAQFKSEADLVEHLATTYNFGKTATDLLLKHKSVYLIKHAFDNQQGSREEQLRGTWHKGIGQGQDQMQEQDEGPQVLDESLLEDMAEFEDPDMLDTGMIASIAQTDDIKSLLIDSTHVFEDTVSEVGKSILLFSIKKGTVEGQYGREEFSNVVNKLRNVFTTLGHLVFDMNEYINNRSYQSDEI